jgi:hypothetical protein
VNRSVTIRSIKETYCSGMPLVRMFLSRTGLTTFGNAACMSRNVQLRPTQSVAVPIWVDFFKLLKKREGEKCNGCNECRERGERSRNGGGEIFSIDRSGCPDT